jgi:hypothetical protein
MFFMSYHLHETDICGKLYRFPCSKATYAVSSPSTFYPNNAMMNLTMPHILGENGFKITIKLGCFHLATNMIDFRPHRREIA